MAALARTERSPSPKQAQQPQQQFASQSDSPFAVDSTGVPLHPGLRSVLRFNAAHQQKVYHSGRLTKRVERGTDGTPPIKDEGWIDIWCQLSGVTLSIWSMKAIERANVRGEQAPPQYVNITDAVGFVLFQTLILKLTRSWLSLTLVHSSSRKCDVACNTNRPRQTNQKYPYA